MVGEEDLDRAADILRAGGLVVIPTETVYGLATNALDPLAVARIYEVKHRPPTSPLIVHVSSIGMARALAAEWPPEATLLAERYWPGPLTLVVPKRTIVPDIVTAGLSTVALRMPAHPVAREVLRRCSVPLAAPSANRFSELSPTAAEHVRGFEEGIPILDGGPCEVGIESTVLSLAEPDGPVLLRPGAVTLAEIEALLGRRVSIRSAAEGPHPSPGMHTRHYSPHTPLVVVRNGALPAGSVAYVYWRSPAVATHTIEMPADAALYAQRLYDALHRADATSVDWIAVEAPPDGAEWDAVRDRLNRAGYTETLPGGQK